LKRKHFAKRALSQKCVKSRRERTCAALVDRIEQLFHFPPATHTLTHTRTHLYKERAQKWYEKQSKTK